MALNYVVLSERHGVPLGVERRLLIRAAEITVHVFRSD